MEFHYYGPYLQFNQYLTFCNKMNPTARPEGIPDGMMCWAASGASILHWWFDQNKQYIDMYDYKGPDYHTGMTPSHRLPNKRAISSNVLSTPLPMKRVIRMLV